MYNLINNNKYNHLLEILQNSSSPKSQASLILCWKSWNDDDEDGLKEFRVLTSFLGLGLFKDTI